MDKYAEIYLSKLASECKEAGIGDVVSNIWNGAKSIGKTFVVDPAVGMFTDTGSAIGSAAKGDWSAAGGSALSALGNTLMTAGNVATLVPGVGTAIGAGARGLGLAAKGLKGVAAIKGLTAGGKVVGLANKALKGTEAAQKALGAAGVLNETKNIVGAGGKVLGQNFYQGGKLFGPALDPAIKGIGEVTTSRLRQGASGLAGNISHWVDKYKNFLGNTPLGGLTGFKSYGLNKLPPLTRTGKIMSAVKPLAGFMGLQVGADALRNGGLESQFNDLSVDPNFREWMGPDRQDALLERARTSADKINSMRELRDGGYLDTYKKHLSNTLKEQQQRLSDEARLKELDQIRRQNVG